MNTVCFDLSAKIRNYGNSFSALIGFDGFIDEIVHVVDQRTSPESFTRIQTISDFSHRIIRSQGLSSNMEIVPVQTKLGGNGPILTRALLQYGADLSYIGCIGKTVVDPVFQELANHCHVYGIADPGYTTAYEFNDGKIMMTNVEHFNDLSWENIISKIDLSQLVLLVDQSDLVGMENWALLPHMSDIWESFLTELVPRLTSSPGGKVCFFDIADPEKRSREDILKALRLIGRFSESGFRVVLGLNLKEACEIAELYGHSISDYHDYPLPDLCEELSRHIAIDSIVIHPTDRACCYQNGGFHLVRGLYCEHPKLTTGAGDTFNSGFLFGYINGFSPEECLLCGVGASGFYVRNAYPPTLHELAGFITDIGNAQDVNSGAKM